METPQLSHEVYSNEVPTAVFVREVLSRALPYVESFRWPTDQKSLSLFNFPALVRQKTNAAEEAVYSVDDGCVRVEISDGYVKGDAAGAPEQVAKTIEVLRKLLPPIEGDEELVIPFTFWRHSSRGPVASQRGIAVSPWAAVKENYPNATRDQLAPLIEDFRPARTGHLLLWHGEPGTGKTHALCSLAWEWRDWCRVEYVVDPEKFLGDSEYLMRVLLEDPDEGHHEPDIEARRRWRLLTLEDAGELIASGARDQVGQRLSRLLNTVDGILGYGLRLLVLITTNEPLSGLHPAVARDGRCAAEIEFGKFSIGEANRWGPTKGVANIAHSSMTLAELFAAAEGRGIRSRPRDRGSGFYL